MKTANLEGAELDRWVARALFGDKWEEELKLLNGSLHYPDYAPSTTWEEAGEIIERKKISLICFKQGWAAYIDGNDDYQAFFFDGADGAGPTPLIAATRAIVASEFGEEVGESN